MKIIAYFIVGLTSLLGLAVGGYAILLALRDMAVDMDETKHLVIGIVSIIYSLLGSFIVDKLEENIGL